MLVLWVVSAFVVGFVVVREHLEPPPLYAAGIAVGKDGGVVDLPVGAHGHYLPGTSIFVAEDPELQRRLAGKDHPHVEKSRAWLARGTDPGAYGPYADMAERALLDLRLMTGSDGAVVAGEQRYWTYVWPRDASFAVAAYTTMGHPDEAELVLRYLDTIHPRSGVWHARYRTDGSGQPPDDRGTQLDGSGWVPWATWVWYSKVGEQPGEQAEARRTLRELWPMVSASADAAARSVGPDGLPAPSMDYWETRKDQVTLGTAAPLLLGLRASADLAHRLGRTAAANRWTKTADRLQLGVNRTFGRVGYPRFLPAGGADSAVTFLAPPFAQADTRVRDAVREADATLTLANGGMKPGAAWRPDGVAWMPETALFALAAAGMGDQERAKELLDWIDEHRTSVGALPEQVTRTGEPASVAPLAWTASTVLLTLATLEDDPGIAPPRRPESEECTGDPSEPETCALLDP